MSEIACPVSECVDDHFTERTLGYHLQGHDMHDLKKALCRLDPSYLDPVTKLPLLTGTKDETRVSLSRAIIRALQRNALVTIPRGPGAHEKKAVVSPGSGGRD